MKDIYLAGPFFSETQIEKIKRLREVLNCNITTGNVFVPMEHQEVPGTEKFTPEWGKGIYKSDMDHLKQADIIVAVIDFDGKDCDSGTAFELGVAETMYKPIVIIQEEQIDTNLMLSGSCDFYATKIEDLAEYDFDDPKSNEFTGKVF